ncbi:hypothetical protein TcasGA2_TC011811 [Tribolium castaneum]|uniref:Uncharacterized protein n=1 Tax=Tribolium castaneum TaxID=7070 RepID=D6WZM1_TRICA|nr:hypothetical protein TcasGA2_TC011811 [Tribolium castaneum]
MMKLKRWYYNFYESKLSVTGSRMLEVVPGLVYLKKSAVDKSLYVHMRRA